MKTKLIYLRNLPKKIIDYPSQWISSIANGQHPDGPLVAIRSSHYKYYVPIKYIDPICCKSTRDVKNLLLLNRHVFGDPQPFSFAIIYDG